MQYRFASEDTGVRAEYQVTDAPTVPVSPYGWSKLMTEIMLRDAGRGFDWGSPVYYVASGAWVALARTHLWIAEPEKGRHEAQELMTVLGPKSMEAYAGCYLALGIQDGSAKRIALARREFQAAMAAAPQSVYAKQAAQALAALPGEAK